MMPNQLISFADAIAAIDGEDKNILLGNGFSLSQSETRVFSYSNLLEKSNLPEGSEVRSLFAAFNSCDFELVINALEHAAKVCGTYRHDTQKSQFERDVSQVREALIYAIKAVHPAIQFEIPQPQIKACGEFLGQFNKIFTLNYDLLMYWVNLNHTPRAHTDGFGLSDITDGFRSFSEDAHCSVYHLHGGLHLFRSSSGETLKRISTGTNTILQDIEETIRSKKMLPLFVAEGTSANKVAKINSTPYLKFGLDKLKEAAAPIFIFGHSASERDEHIYDAIFYGNASDVYFCVYDPDRNLTAIRERLARYPVRSRAQIHYVDARTMDIWTAS